MSPPARQRFIHMTHNEQLPAIKLRTVFRRWLELNNYSSSSSKWKLFPKLDVQVAAHEIYPDTNKCHDAATPSQSPKFLRKEIPTMNQIMT